MRAGRICGPKPGKSQPLPSGCHPAPVVRILMIAALDAGRIFHDDPDVDVGFGNIL
jgi:hypothetical protein